MSGTYEGGIKARDKNLEKDPDFYSKIGRKGGLQKTTGGFAGDPALARSAGFKGGTISRKIRKNETEKEHNRRIEEIRKELWG